MAERIQDHKENEPSGLPLPDFKYFHKNGSNTLDIVLNGMKFGMNSPLVVKITEAAQNSGESVLAFDFPYFSRGDATTSGKNLEEEVNALRAVLEFAKSQNFERVRLIGKSLGGIVAAKYLDTLPEESRLQYSVVVLGYDTGDIDLSRFPGEITVIQGTEDDHGTPVEVLKDLGGAVAKKITCVPIQGADHSFRVPGTKDFAFEDEAVKAIFNS